MSKASKAIKSALVSVSGRVQGVGFRPFVYRLAKKHSIKGEVRNTPQGAEIHAEGRKSDISRFVKEIRKHAPGQSRISSIRLAEKKPAGFPSFSISSSRSEDKLTAEIPPDIAVCGKCLKEMKDPSDRRYKYPFINCTECGPRFSIIRKLPYDRPNTTMSVFKMCGLCGEEYSEPLDRRFHAQPDACPECGPEIVLRGSDFAGISETEKAVVSAARLISEGRILAVKGIGGYHLCCDAENMKSVQLLRKRKNRPAKPFALMAADVEAVKKLCLLSRAEKKLLCSPARPIILLKKRKNLEKASYDVIAPQNAFLGIMLPYAPLHHLLFDSFKRIRKNAPAVFVMTSANLADEPISRTEEEAKIKLAGIADYFLTHDREIHNRCDDSIIMLPEPSSPVYIRKSRGYVPDSISIFPSRKMPCVFAAGAELKNTFTLTRGVNAYVSQYIGDLDNREALRFYEESFKRFTEYLKVTPSVAVHDLHPDYLSTVFARELSSKTGIRTVAVQHHKAHVASVMAEKGVKKPVIGVAFDGNGLGEDGNVWGGEFFTVNNGNIERAAQMEYFALPGGDQAVREIWRCGLSLLESAYASGISEVFKKRPVDIVSEMIRKGVNCPKTSSVGRIFDGVAAILGLRDEVSYEAQGAIELESLALDFCARKVYNFSIDTAIDGTHVISIRDMVLQILKDKRNGADLRAVSSAFHNTLAEIIKSVCVILARRHGIRAVALSGGVFQNRILHSLAAQRLEASGFDVYFNELVPPNDGGISLGQAWLAANNSNE
ncbi:MAG: carbamoyltransferase HypF [Endomicrobiales bacterium]|nr:carbamoyltransferase HypF [Endomicrobiales bacterium]